MQELPSTTWNKLDQELVSFVHTRVRDLPTAQDIVQEVLIKAHTRSGQLKEEGKMVPWIYGITRNALADHYSNKRKTDSGVVLDWDIDHNEFNECVAYCLKVLMASLPEKYRTPLELTELENLSQYELAERLNMSYSGARSRVQRARKLLKERLDALYEIKTDAYGNIIACEDRLPCCCDRKC